jgi:hypothetical protein
MFRLISRHVLVFGLCTGFSAAVWSQTVPVDFAHTVAPILKKHCAECHAGDQKNGGFSLNSRDSLLDGSENGAVVEPGHASDSRLLEVLTSEGDDRMPPEGEPLSAAEVATLTAWINGGLQWEDGFQFKQSAYEPPLKPRRPELPPARPGRLNPIDRILDADLAARNQAPLPTIDDATFARRASLDLVGLLPTNERMLKFMRDTRTDKRERFVDELLADDTAYAEHWLTFWNDLLRNDYGGTGFITGGRRQVSKWLYEALVNNKPFDQMARELIAPPTDESRGFIEGIRWRGEVSAGQTVEIQFSQSIAQSFLGINMKCASCHDSFIDRWKLDEAYGLAAIYANTPLEIHRCDKPVGRKATASWLFPELGQVDANAPQPERLKQLAALMTHPENGRFSRTIVNRLWYRMMGRGIVHPLDAMQTPPWNQDLLDLLAVDFTDEGYNLKHTLRLIATSQAYQSPVEVVKAPTEDSKYQYAGPRAKRMTAEQFVDTVWQITDAAPNQFDAPVQRGKPEPVSDSDRDVKLTAQWIWGKSATAGAPASGETLHFHHEFTLDGNVKSAGSIITCDNEYTLFINGVQVAKDVNWESIESAPLMKGLKPGLNKIDVIGRNAGSGPNLAGLYFEARIHLVNGSIMQVKSDDTWTYSDKIAEVKGNRIAPLPKESLQPVVIVPAIKPWSDALTAQGLGMLLQTSRGNLDMVRAGLLKSDFLMRSLGRPNRDQIVSQRPSDLSTLEAIDLANGETLAQWLSQGAAKLHAEGHTDAVKVTRELYRFALSREPTAEELATVREILGDTLTPPLIEDLLWSVIVQPEFQLIR